MGTEANEIAARLESLEERRCAVMCIALEALRQIAQPDVRTAYTAQRIAHRAIFICVALTEKGRIPTAEETDEWKKEMGYAD